MNDLPFLVFEMQIPPLELTKNGRDHWAVKARATKAYRSAVAAILNGTRKRQKIATRERAVIRATFFWPDRRRRDRGNAMARMEAVWDGMEDAFIIMNDEGLTFLPCVFEVDKKRQRVKVEVFDA